MIRYYLAPYGPGYISERRYANTSKIHLYRGPNDDYQVEQSAPWCEWCLTLFDAEQESHDLAQADPEIRLIPLWDNEDLQAANYLPLSALISQIAPTFRTAMANYLEARNIPAHYPWVQGTDTISSVVKKIIMILQIWHKLREDYPNLSLNLTVADIPLLQRQRVITWMTNNGIDPSPITLAWTIREVIVYILQNYSWPPIMEFGTHKL